MQVFYIIDQNLWYRKWHFVHLWNARRFCRREKRNLQAEIEQDDKINLSLLNSKRTKGRWSILTKKLQGRIHPNRYIWRITVTVLREWWLEYIQQYNTRKDPHPKDHGQQRDRFAFEIPHTLCFIITLCSILNRNVENITVYGETKPVLLRGLLWNLLIQLAN